MSETTEYNFFDQIKNLNYLETAKNAAVLSGLFYINDSFISDMILPNASSSTRKMLSVGLSVLENELLVKNFI